jgi:MFS family permease
LRPVRYDRQLGNQQTHPARYSASDHDAGRLEIGTVYLIGEVIGTLVFGRMSDNLGRRKLFTWTLAEYLVGTGLMALTPKGTDWIAYLYATRIISGVGIGGEYSAINSAIDETMPARYRGRTDVWINGTYWLGAIIGTFATFLLLSSLRTSEGWRVAFNKAPCRPAVFRGPRPRRRSLRAFPALRRRGLCPAAGPGTWDGAAARPPSIR